MHHEHLAHSLELSWVSPVLSLLFLSGAFFYIFRLFNPGLLRRVNGYFDRENEFWHGACLLGMVACLTPSWLPLPDLVWKVGFAVGTGWYLVRALTYGKRLPHNKQWYDFAHAAMLFGMWWMFANPIEHVLINVAFGAYWLWFGSYYVYRLWLDVHKPSLLAFGQDGAHFLMSFVMLIMTLWPTALHDHGRHHEMAGGPAVEHTTDSGASEAGNSPVASVATVVADENFDAMVVNRTGTVVVLVSGGCVNCATEIPVFERVAGTFSKEFHFVRLHKDAAPKACAWLKANDCPAILIVRAGHVVARLDGFSDQDEMTAFVKKYLD